MTTHSTARVFPTSQITGTGVVTALGADLKSTWNALVDGRYITSHAPALLTSDDRKVSRVAALATRAATEAIAAAGWSHDSFLDPSTAVVFGTSKGNITDWITGPDALGETSTAGWTDASFGLAQVCDQMCDRLGRPAGAKITLSAACASGLHALIRADLMLRSGLAERALVVAAEASIHPLFIASFERLGVLARGDDPGRPFDQNRSGFRMSEAAAAVTLELAKTSRSDASSIAFTSMVGEASNLVSGDIQGHALACLLDRAFAGRSFDVIHAHGTGTILNDRLEQSALEAAVAKAGCPAPHLYSHKGALGHSLGASGLVSVVLAEQMHRRGELLSMPTTTRPVDVRNLKLKSAGPSPKPKQSLILANGFGGPQTAVALSST